MVQSATATAASSAEVTTGTDIAKYITPSALAGSSPTFAGYVYSNNADSAFTLQNGSGTNKAKFGWYLNNTYLDYDGTLNFRAGYGGANKITLASDGTLSVLGTTSSTSTTTGALIVGNGTPETSVGIGNGKAYFGGDVNIATTVTGASGNLQVGAAGQSTTTSRVLVYNGASNTATSGNLQFRAGYGGSFSWGFGRDNATGDFVFQEGTTARVKILAGGALSATGNGSNYTTSFLSGGATAYAQFVLGRASQDVAIAAIANANEFFTGTAAGDVAFVLTGAKKFHFGRTSTLLSLDTATARTRLENNSGLLFDNGDGSAVYLALRNAGSGELEFTGSQNGASGYNFYSTIGAASTRTLALTNEGSVVAGLGAVATNATNGFLYVPTCAGTPAGTPTTKTGFAPIVVDTTNNKVYFYSGGAWRDAGP